MKSYRAKQAWRQYVMYQIWLSHRRRKSCGFSANWFPGRFWSCRPSNTTRCSASPALPPLWSVTLAQPQPLWAGVPYSIGLLPDANVQLLLCFTAAPASVPLPVVPPHGVSFKPETNTKTHNSFPE